MKIFSLILDFIDRWLEDTECPNCGHYCTGKTVYCNQPNIKDDLDKYAPLNMFGYMDNDD